MKYNGGKMMDKCENVARPHYVKRRAVEPVRIVAKLKGMQMASSIQNNLPLGCWLTTIDEMATFLKLFCVMGKTPLLTEMEWIKLVKGSWKTQLSLVLAIMRGNDPHTLAIYWRILENFPFHQCTQLWTYFFFLLKSRVGKSVSGRKAQRKWPDAYIAVTGYWSKRPVTLTP